MFRKTSSVVLFVLTVQMVHAQVPDRIRYQGKLADGAGLANAQTTMVFRLLSAPSGGVQLYAETQAVLVVDGLYSVSLGDSNPVSGSLGRVFTNAAVYLELQVGPTTLAPREQIQAVGYAMLAGAVTNGAIQSAQLANAAVTSAKIASGAVGSSNIANNAISNQHVAAGSLSGAQIANNSLTAADIGSNTFWETTGNSGTTAGTHFLGTAGNQPMEIRVNNQRALRLQYGNDFGFDNIVVLGGHSANVATGLAAVVSGGGYQDGPNIVSDDFGFIGGGAANIAGDQTASDADFATVVGGEGNRAADNYGFIGGGRTNATLRPYGVVAGGRQNIAGDDYTFVGGGHANVVTGDYAVIGGGLSNVVSGTNATVGGGIRNIASGSHAVVPGGFYNQAQGRGSFAVGTDNVASGQLSAVVGGTLNLAAGSASLAAGGQMNMVYGLSSVVLGGGGFDSFIPGVVTNLVAADFAAIVGGGNNVVTGRYSAVFGGRDNKAGGAGAVVVGGLQNEAQAGYAFAAGRRAHAMHQGTFVWADSTDADFATDRQDTFLVRATNGVGINYENPSGTLHVVGSYDLGSVIVVPNSGLETDSELVLGENRQAQYGFRMFYDGGTNAFRLFGFTDYTNILPAHMTVLRNSGDVGLGVMEPEYNLHVVGDPTLGSFFVGPSEAGSDDDSEIVMGEDDDGSFGMRWFYDGGQNRLFLYGISSGSNTGPHWVVERNSGRTGIGTTNLSTLYQLSVGGAIRAEEVVVESGWADYVFDKDYQLRPLEEVERHIEEEGHLPGVPSAEDVRASGLSLGEMQSLLMEKIEELTLYTLQQQKEIDALRSTLQGLEKETQP